MGGGRKKLQRPLLRNTSPLANPGPTSNISDDDNNNNIVVSRVVARRQTYSGIISTRSTDRIATVIRYYFVSLYTVYFVLRVRLSSTRHIIIFHTHRVGIGHASFSSRQTHTHGKKTYVYTDQQVGVDSGGGGDVGQ